jgi:hypothetical protein
VRRRSSSATDQLATREPFSILKKLPKLKKLFNRTLQFKVGAHNILLGSNLLTFRCKEHPSISLHLLPKDHPVDHVKCLDLWLDNMMNGVPALVICLHTAGVVESYEMLRTEDLPTMTRGCAGFAPDVVIHNANEMLEFLREACCEDGSTYWLYKEAMMNPGRSVEGEEEVAS